MAPTLRFILTIAAAGIFCFTQQSTSLALVVQCLQGQRITHQKERAVLCEGAFTEE